MCGRYVVAVDPESIYGEFGIDGDGDSGGSGADQSRFGPYGGDPIRPRYNIAPTDEVPVVLNRSTDGDRSAPIRRLEPMRWGLVPGWAKDLSIGSRQFNVRAETLGTKFRAALERRRCLLPASGFYEWQKVEGPAARTGRTRTPGASTGRGARGAAKQAYYVTPPDGSLLALAGVWEFWRSPDGEPVRSTTVITVPAVGRMAQIHDRMPLLLPAPAWARWLSLTAGADEVSGLLAAPSAEAVDALEFRPVGERAGNVRNDDPELIQRVEPMVDLDDLLQSMPTEPGQVADPAPVAGATVGVSRPRSMR